MKIAVKTDVRSEMDIIALVAMEIAERMHKESERLGEIIKAMNAMAKLVEFDGKYIQELKTSYLTPDQQKEELVIAHDLMRGELVAQVPVEIA